MTSCILDNLLFSHLFLFYLSWCLLIIRLLLCFDSFVSIWIINRYWHHKLLFLYLNHQVSLLFNTFLELLLILWVLLFLFSLSFFTNITKIRKRYILLVSNHNVVWTLFIIWSIEYLTCLLIRIKPFCCFTVIGLSSSKGKITLWFNFF